MVGGDCGTDSEQAKQKKAEHFAKKGETKTSELETALRVVFMSRHVLYRKAGVGGELRSKTRKLRYC